VFNVQLHISHTTSAQLSCHGIQCSKQRHNRLKILRILLATTLFQKANFSAFRSLNLTAHEENNLFFVLILGYTCPRSLLTRGNDFLKHSFYEMQPRLKSSHLNQRVNKLPENCARLRYCAASSGNFLPTFRDNLSGPILVFFYS
jgi:hypothetical protein